MEQPKFTKSDDEELLRLCADNRQGSLYHWPVITKELNRITKKNFSREQCRNRQRDLYAINRQKHKPFVPTGDETKFRF